MVGKVNDIGHVLNVHNTHCILPLQKLLYSPDTDVYHIGLSAISECTECDVIVQLSKNTDDKARYLYMTNLITALQKDPDLSQIPQLIRPQVIQSLYVATGCDYTSFFTGLGKVSFLATFFQHASFIAGCNAPPGTMGEMSTGQDSNSKFSFLRLIGCAYYKQHTSTFRSQTPEALFYSICDTNTVYEHHAKWLAMIRSTVRQRVDTESKSIPSTEALLLHWKRCTWVVAMWHCATLNHINLPGSLYVHALYRRTCTCNIYCDTLYLLHSINRVWMDEEEWQTRDNLGSV